MKSFESDDNLHRPRGKKNTFSLPGYTNETLSQNYKRHFNNTFYIINSNKQNLFSVFI